ncbi:hypothetical protein ACIQ62_08045 [Streptomyces sp. NPDC096319]|uniref:hypothetical protein n=1 Tax=Streptomyces sp. NPDC096319 TaxID=3366084 RepID=UPI0037F8B47B
MDVEKVTEELYGLKPADFVAARDAYVAEARGAKDPTSAKAIAALRRPATAAWAANLLARERPQEARGFLSLGRTLREAHRTLDAERMREASRERHRLVGTLARTAAALARDAGQPVSDTVVREIEQTLQGVLAHQDVAELWSKGRLVKVPEAAVDFTEITPDTVPPRPAPKRERKSVDFTEITPDTVPPRPAPKRERKERNGDTARLDRARAAATEADAEVARRERELDEAERARRTAATAAGEAADRVGRLEADLREARRARADTEAAASMAGTSVTSAERALKEARRTAERAARALEGLERHDS